MKVAVFLRGHKRTWDYIKKQNLDFFQQLGDEVDYYVSVWNIGNVDTICDDFPKNKLKVFEKNDDHKNFDAVTGPLYQSKILSEHKYKNEISSSVYDLVLDTRFDVLFYNFDKQSYLQEIHDHKNRLGSSCVYPLHAVGIDDHIFLLNSKNEIFWRNRDISLTKENSHKTFYDFSKLYDLEPYTINWFSTIITRPNIANLDDLSHHENLLKSLGDWNDDKVLDLKAKLELLSKTNINPEEYYFQLENCS